MCVGSLENVGIVPCGICVVGPALDAGAAVHAAAGGVAADEAVAQCCGLSTGQKIVGICIAVCIAVEDAELCKEVHVALSPVAVEIFKLVVADVGDGEQTSDHSGELGTGDILVGTEVAVVVAGDNAGLDEGADLFVAPAVCVDVLKGAGSALVLCAGLGSHETVEDSCDLGTGDVGVGTNGAVFVAYHVCKVIGVVKADVEHGVEDELVGIKLCTEGPLDAGQGAVLYAGDGAVAGSCNSVYADNALGDKSKTEQVSGVCAGLAGNVIGECYLSAACRQLAHQGAVNQISGELDAVYGVNDAADGIADGLCVSIVGESRSGQKCSDHQNRKKQADQFC